MSNIHRDKNIFCSDIFLPYNNLGKKIWEHNQQSQNLYIFLIYLEKPSAVILSLNWKKKYLNHEGKELGIGWYDRGLDAALLINECSATIA